MCFQNTQGFITRRVIEAEMLRSTTVAGRAGEAAGIPRAALAPPEVEWQSAGPGVRMSRGKAAAAPRANDPPFFCPARRPVGRLHYMARGAAIMNESDDDLGLVMHRAP